MVCACSQVLYESATCIPGSPDITTFVLNGAQRNKKLHPLEIRSSFCRQSPRSGAIKASREFRRVTKCQAKNNAKQPILQEKQSRCLVEVVEEPEWVVLLPLLRPGKINYEK